VFTRQESEERVAVRPAQRGKPGRLGWLDPVEAVASVARSRRELLLAAHRRRLSREDLEDCYSQATLELLTRARRAGAFACKAHIANALEQRLLSRIHDRRRALSGRSPIEAAIAMALPLAACESGGVEIVDARANVERLVLLRHDLLSIGRISCELSPDQRLVLASQLSCEMGCSEFCRIHGWSAEKYRKVAQRARARLARLLADERLPAAPSAQRAHAELPVPLFATRRIREQGPTYEHPSPHT
jgi:DNA-directed RNA polymerase specialized sigma24 family protein